MTERDSLVLELATMIEHLDRHIQRRAEDLAAGPIREAREAAAKQVRKAQDEATFRDEVNAELQRRADSAQNWFTAWRSSEARPRAYPSRELTPDERERQDRGECGVWPAWIQVCDPAISTDGDTLWVSCTGDDRASSDSPTPICAVEPGDRWSEIVAQVAAHRCQRDEDVTA